MSNKKNKNKGLIHINPLDVRDELHLDAQIRFPANVYENKKKKKSKYPKKDFEKLLEN